MVFNTSIDIYYFISEFMFAFFGFCFLFKLRKLNSDSSFKKLFYIPIGKSASNSQSMGGFVYFNSLLLFFSLRVMIYNNFFASKLLISVAVFGLASFVILAYGYLDDCHEVKARYKILAQFMAVNIVAGLSFILFNDYHPNLTYCFIMFFGMACLNGANLMDGADTISIKVGSSIFLYFTCLSLTYNLPLVFNLSIFSLLPLIAFYPFNRFPSKIHLGEIGGAFLGLVYLFLSVMTFYTLKHKTDTINALISSTFPLLFPVGELAITFIRRIYYRKNIFSGDHFHIHHLLIRHLKLSVKETANYLGATVLISLLIQLYVSIYLQEYSLSSCLLIVFSLLFTYLSLGHSFWKKSAQYKKTNKTSTNVFNLKKIELVSTKIIDDFEFTIREASSENCEFKTKDYLRVEEKKKAA